GGNGFLGVVGAVFVVEPQFWACVAERGDPSLSERVATSCQCSPGIRNLAVLPR
ncbi:hypothetical protein A2U01_0052010, partial [Trifolium medium]|nr:hypothetical protein [Trifolium medium]